VLRAIRRNPWVTTIAFLSIGLSLYLAIQYFILGADQSAFVQDKRNQMSLSELWYAMIYIHAGSAIIAICLGWMQFISRFRSGAFRLHKAIGRVYSACVVIAGLTGIFLSFYATGGIVSGIGFLILSLLWLYTLAKGIKAIVVEKNPLEHRRWMTRNYALTFAAVTLRIYLPLCMMIFGFEYFNDYYRVIAWACWVPNLVVAEMLLRRV